MNVIVALPTPLAAPVIVIHDEDDFAVQLQFAPVVSLTVPVPPLSDIRTEVGFTVYVHAVVDAACVTDTV